MLHGWDNFYLMMGSAAAALIGLLFVVMTLTSGFERSQALRGASLYMTPTALHFGVVLSTSAVTLAPGLPLSVIVVLLGVIALAGLGYSVRSCIGIANPRQGAEPPHWSDFWTYGASPAAIYVGLCVAIVALWVRAEWGPYAIAGLLLVLLLVGIRNAWDLITWIAPKRPDSSA